MTLEFEMGNVDETKKPLYSVIYDADFPDYTKIFPVSSQQAETMSPLPKYMAEEKVLSIPTTPLYEIFPNTVIKSPLKSESVDPVVGPILTPLTTLQIEDSFSFLKKPVTEWSVANVLMFASTITCNSFGIVQTFSTFSPELCELSGKELIRKSYEEIKTLLGSANENVANVFYNKLQNLIKRDNIKVESDSGVESDEDCSNSESDASSNDDQMETESPDASVLRKLISSSIRMASSVQSQHNDDITDDLSMGFSEDSFLDKSAIPKMIIDMGGDDPNDDDVPKKKRPGRPRGTSKVERPPKIGKLWENIIDWLSNPEYNPSIITWVDYNGGIFKFTDSEQAAKLWGKIKGNSEMSFEKMTRAMRHHYKKQILIAYPKRLVYQFGSNATGWNRVCRNY